MIMVALQSRGKKMDYSINATKATEKQSERKEKMGSLLKPHTKINFK